METVIIPILPRPVKQQPLTPIAPRPIRRDSEPQPLPDNAPSANPDSLEGVTEDIPLTASNVLLKAIIETSRKPETPVTRMALRKLVTKAAREIALDF